MYDEKNQQQDLQYQNDRHPYGKLWVQCFVVK